MTDESSESLPPRQKRLAWVLGVVLALGTGIAFCQVLDFDFVSFDDPVYITNNSSVQGGFNLDTVIWAFTETKKSAHYHPLTWISLAVDYELFRLNPRYFHLTNLLLHLAGTLLLFAVLLRSTRAVWPSFATAALFAWHPLHVESVAWISERKDVLSTFFWMLTMLLYVEYVRTRSVKLYVEMLTCFVLGLLSKPMVVTLPCVLLLWDLWPLGRWQRPHRLWLIWEKLPLFALSLASGLWTFIVMAAGTVRHRGEVITVADRIDNALISCVVYLRKMFWPDDLAPYYPAPLAGFPQSQAILAAVILLAITLLALFTARRHPYLLVGWLWYVGTLLPVSLRLQAGSYSWADRYTYVPLIGVFIALAWGVNDLLLAWSRRVKRSGHPTSGTEMALAPRSVGAVLIVGSLAACMIVTWQQVKIWQNSETLWTHTLAVTEDNFLANVNLGIYLRDKEGRADVAERCFLEAVRVHPDLAEGHAWLGRFYQDQKKFEQADREFRRAVELDPSDRYLGMLEQLERIRKQPRK